MFKKIPTPNPDILAFEVIGSIAISRVKASVLSPTK